MPCYTLVGTHTEHGWAYSTDTAGMRHKGARLPINTKINRGNTQVDHENDEEGYRETDNPCAAI